MTDEDSNLVQHAIRELEFAGVEEDVRPSIIDSVRAFASYGHSGGSASVVIPMLNDLLQFKNISPLTDDPREWNHVAESMAGQDNLWQSARRSDAFSHDGGHTYYCLDEERFRIPDAIRRRLPGDLKYVLSHWLPWALRQRLPRWATHPIHHSVPTGFIIGVAE
jgi:hypothetical protein